jgi:integrase
MGIKRVYSEDNHCDMYEADYRVRLPSGKHKRIRKMYFTREAARRAIMRDKVAAEKGEYAAVAKVTLAEWAERVNKYVRAHRKGTTIKSYALVTSIFISVCGEGRRVESLDRSDLRRFIEHLKDDGKTDATTRQYYSRLRAALSLAPQLFQELISWHPPTYRYEGFSRPRERVLEPDEIRALLSHLSPEMQDIVLCALNTGGRLTEVLSLTWANVHTKAPGYPHGALRLRVTKVRGMAESWRVVPATAELALILTRRRVEATSTFVFPSSHDHRKPRKQIAFQLREACEKAGIAYGRETPGGFVFHDLRRTAVTYLRRSGADIETVCSITGHSPAVMLKVYSKTSTAQQQKALDNLANMLPFGQLRVLDEIEEEEKEPEPVQESALTASGD